MGNAADDPIFSKVVYEKEDNTYKKQNSSKKIHDKSLSFFSILYEKKKSPVQAERYKKESHFAMNYVRFALVFFD